MLAPQTHETHYSFTLHSFTVSLLTSSWRVARTLRPRTSLRVSGHVEATETRLAPDAGGRILTLTIKEGDRVKPGQTILTLDTRDVQLAINRAQAEQGAAEAQLRLVQAGSRVEDIRQAQSQVETARAEVSAARAELDAAAQDLDAIRDAAAEQLRLAQAARRRRDPARRGARPRHLARRAASGPPTKSWRS